jgi:coenzyme F420-0:L-glutamate ligase/coenzyme F420-1:gamma-L-glutamate ligase
MELYALKTGLIKRGDDLVKVILDSMDSQNLKIENGDILAITSKVVSVAEGRTARLSESHPTRKALMLAHDFDLPPAFAQLVLNESEEICDGVKKAILTLKNGVLTANAGVDNKNARSGEVILWPKDSVESAKCVREAILSGTGKNVAVLIVDSGLVPLRIGTSGLALAVVGFKPIRDDRNKMDLYGKKVQITRHAVADDLASAAHLLMGETVEKIPVVLVRGAPVEFDNGAYGSKDVMMPPEEDIFASTFSNGLRRLRK